MKHIALLCLICCFISGNKIMAQEGKDHSTAPSESKGSYQAFVYMNSNLDDKIKEKWGDHRRSLAGDSFEAALQTSKTLISGGIVNLVDLGVNWVGALMTQNKRNHSEWEKIVNTENCYEETIPIQDGFNDFYSDISYEGAMDPNGMAFNGIGCLRMEGKDTVFYLSCHVDEASIDRIICHSKFQLVLDTLIINPYHSNLPNNRMRKKAGAPAFSFKDRQNLRFSMDMVLSSSWINQAIQLHKDQELGRFTLTIPVNEKSLDANGVFRYVRTDKIKYPVMGESFIVPRSYIGFRDGDDQYRDCWGTGEYKLSITLKESCSASPEFRENWKKDWKALKSQEKKKPLLNSAWQSIISQKWDENAKQWVITVLKAPAGVVTDEMLEKLELKDSSSNAKAGAGSAGAAASGAKAAAGGAGAKAGAGSAGAGAGKQ